MFVLFEICIDKSDAGSYLVETRLTVPNDPLIPERRIGLAHFNFIAFRENETRMDEYGKLLGKSLFADATIKQHFEKARLQAQMLKISLRVLLVIGWSARELHELRWESLRDADGESLVTSENVIFSRYLPRKEDSATITRQSKRDLRALVVIANPKNLGHYLREGKPLPAIDVAFEFSRAENALDPIECKPIPQGERATLNYVITNLREGYPILYLVCHGAFRHEPVLYLENEEGNVDTVMGTTLLEQVKGLHKKPILVVLASCQSAGKGEEDLTADQGVLSALGPGLISSGIPAVVAMNGNVTMKTSGQFTTIFFEELQRDGQVDKAAAAARAGISRRADSWVPVLFLQLIDGCLWFQAGFDKEEEFPKWPTLLRKIQGNECTPILGAGLTEPLYGHTKDIALRLVKRHNIPLAPPYQGDLPQVAQYLSVFQDDSFARKELMSFLREELLERFKDRIPDASKLGLPELLSAIGKLLRAADPADPHLVLAQLPISIYFTANADNLLADALADVGKKPVVRIPPWNNASDPEDEIFSPIESKPDPDHPLVYHLFGHFSRPESLILSEDGHFSYLIGATREKNVPEFIKGALVRNSLLFLGFDFDDWNFRILFRNVISQHGRKFLERSTHVAVQLQPSDNRIINVRQARHYLEQFFQRPLLFSLYWGSVEDFIKDLKNRWPPNP